MKIATLKMSDFFTLPRSRQSPYARDGGLGCFGPSSPYTGCVLISGEFYGREVKYSGSIQDKDLFFPETSSSYRKIRSKNGYVRKCESWSRAPAPAARPEGLHLSYTNARGGAIRPTTSFLGQKSIPPFYINIQTYSDYWVIQYWYKMGPSRTRCIYVIIAWMPQRFADKNAFAPTGRFRSIMIALPTIRYSQWALGRFIFRAHF